MTFIDGAYRFSYLVPIEQNGATAAVLVLAVDIANSLGEQVLEEYRCVNHGCGWRVQRGHAGSGDRVLGPGLDRPAGDDPGTYFARSRTGAPSRSTTATRTGSRSQLGVSTFSNEAFMIRQISTSEAYAGLSPGHLARDALLFSVIAVTLAILALATIWRERALRHDGERLSALLHNSHDIVGVLSRDGKVTFVSSAIVRLLGYSPTFWQGASLGAGVHPGDAPQLQEQFDRALASDRSPRRAKKARSRFSRLDRRPGPPVTAGAVARDVRIRGADGAYRWFDIRIQDRMNDRDIRGVLLTSHEISDRKRLQDQLARQAHYDVLTGLANRAELTRWFAAADDLDRSAPSGPSAPSAPEQAAASPRFSVLFIDLDRFKSINDTFGHRTGDAVLQIVADRLAGLCRDDDGVFRLGGDEFVVVLDDADEAVARAAAERILAALGEPLEVGGRLVDVGATVGVALATPDVHGEQVLRNADRAMYQVKQAGRGAVGIHDATTG